MTPLTIAIAVAAALPTVLGLDWLSRKTVRWILAEPNRKL